MRKNYFLNQKYIKCGIGITDFNVSCFLRGLQLPEARVHLQREPIPGAPTGVSFKNGRRHSQVRLSLRADAVRILLWYVYNSQQLFFFERDLLSLVVDMQDRVL